MDRNIHEHSLTLIGHHLHYGAEDAKTLKWFLSAWLNLHADRIIAGNKSCMCLKIWAPPVEYGFHQRPEKMLIWKIVHFRSWSLFSSWDWLFQRVIKVYQVIHPFIIWKLSSFGFLILATSSTLFWRVLKDIIFPPSPGPTWGLLLIDHRRHPKQMPKPQLATINVVE